MSRHTKMSFQWNTFSFKKIKLIRYKIVIREQSSAFISLFNYKNTKFVYVKNLSLTAYFRII